MFRGTSGSRQWGATLLRGQPWPRCGFAPPRFFWHFPWFDANLAGTLAVPHRRGIIRFRDKAGGGCVGKEVGSVELAVSHPEANAPGPAP